MIIQAGTVGIWVAPSACYSAQYGARVVVTRDYDSMQHEFIYMEFLPETQDLANGQHDGGYYEDQFKFEPQLTLLHLF
jgi:hypothetical protein